MEINKIKIGDRVRKEIGDLSSLKDSISKIGLLHPIVVDENNNLIAGVRRLLACKSLGWKEIDVTNNKSTNKKKGETDENVERKQFTPEEAVLAWQNLDTHQGKLVPVVGTKYSNKPRADSARSEKAEKVTGYSRDSLIKAKQVIDGGDAKLIAKMNKSGNINKAYKEVKKVKEAVQKKELFATVAKTYKEDKDIIVECGSFVDLSKKIVDNSTDLVLTDPPYPKEFLPLWDDLGRVAKDGKTSDFKIYG